MAGGRTVVDREGVAVKVGTGVGVEKVTGSGVFVASVAGPDGAWHATIIAASASAAMASTFILAVYREKNILAMGFSCCLWAGGFKSCPKNRCFDPPPPLC